MAESERAARILARQDAPAQAALMVDCLLDRTGVDLDQLRQDPVGWLREWDEVEVFRLPPSSQPDPEGCAVDGVYLSDYDVPRIGLSESGSVQRDNFTALHELGHHLQQTEVFLLDRLVARPDGGRALEESACDQFAAHILIPDAIAQATLGSGVPSAVAVTRLAEQLPGASRSAIAIRAIQQVEGDGHVVVLDDDGTVLFSASTTAIRPSRGSDQRDTAIWNATQHARPRRPATARGQFRYKGLASGDTYYMQAAPARRGFIVVAVLEKAPWLPIAVNIPEYAAYGKCYVCKHLSCMTEFHAGPNDLCARCGQPTCPRCGRCACSLRAPGEFLCTGCFLWKGAAERAGAGDICTSCS